MATRKRPKRFGGIVIEPKLRALIQQMNFQWDDSGQYANALIHRRMTAAIYIVLSSNNTFRLVIQDDTDKMRSPKLIATTHFVNSLRGFEHACKRVVKEMMDQTAELNRQVMHRNHAILALM
jgi:hypothetical protein